MLHSCVLTDDDDNLTLNPNCHQTLVTLTLNTTVDWRTLAPPETYPPPGYHHRGHLPPYLTPIFNLTLNFNCFPNPIRGADVRGQMCGHYVGRFPRRQDNRIMVLSPPRARCVPDGVGVVTPDCE